MNKKISALDKIRKQYQGEITEKILPLTKANLQGAWCGYVDGLKGNRNPAAHSFEMASLRIVDGGWFDIIPANNIDKKFIELERSKLYSYLKEKLSVCEFIVSDPVGSSPEPIKRLPDEPKKNITKKRSYPELLQSPQWQKKRLEILERDKWTCQLCSDTETQLHVHHMEYQKGRLPWDYPNEIFKTLCKDCHAVVSYEKVITAMAIEWKNDRRTAIVYGYQENDDRVAKVFEISGDRILDVVTLTYGMIERLFDSINKIQPL